MFELKTWWKSKVLWVNFISILILVVQYLTDTHYIDAQKSVLIMGIVNMVLRLVTYKEIKI